MKWIQWIPLSVFLAFYSSASPTPTPPPVGASLGTSLGHLAPEQPFNGMQTYTEEVEQDLPLRRQNPIYLQHHLGSVQVQGWVQDRVRVLMKKRIITTSKQAAHEEFKKMGLISLETPTSFEMRVGKNRGSDIVTKLKQERETSVQIDLEIRAPYHSDLTVILGEDRDLQLSQWRGSLTLNGKNSAVQISKVTSEKPLKVNCQSCTIEVTDSKAFGHLFSGGKTVTLNHVETPKSISIDTGSGDARFENTRGRIEVHSTSGRMTSGNHTGTLSFQSKEGGLFVNGLKGNLEAQTQTGQLMVDVDSVEKYLQLDNQKGDIQVTLNPKFEGNLDLFSLRGEVVVQFAIQLNPKLASESYGPSSPGSMDGYIGTKNHISIHANTKEGGVRILRKVPK